MAAQLAKLCGNSLRKLTPDLVLDKLYSSYNYHCISAVTFQAESHFLYLSPSHQVSPHSGTFMIWSQHCPCLPISIASFLVDFNIVFPAPLPRRFGQDDNHLALGLDNCITNHDV